MRLVIRLAKVGKETKTDRQKDKKSAFSSKHCAASGRFFVR